MSPRLGLLSFDYNRLDAGRMYQLHSERTQYEAEMEAKRLVDAAFIVTQRILSDNKDKIVDLTAQLLEKKELVEADIEKILGPRVNDPNAPLPAIAESALAKYFDAAQSASGRPEHLEKVKPAASPAA